RVERLGQVVQLVPRLPPREALVEVLSADPAGGTGHRVHRPEHRARDHGAARGGERQTERDQDEERLEIAPERALGTLERHAHLDELHEVAVARARQRQQAHGLAGGEPPVREPADEGEDRQENTGVPERQTGADRERHYARTHSAPLSTYPAPRTVWSRRRSPDASIFRLR